MKVHGFVHICEGENGYCHVRSTTIACRWPGTAEDWLEGLVSHRLYRRWEQEPGAQEPQMTYRGARVFRVFPAQPDPREPDQFERGRLMAIWEGPF